MASDRAAASRVQVALHVGPGRGVQGHNCGLPTNEVRADVVRQSQRADAAGANFGDAAPAQRQPDRNHDLCVRVAYLQSCLRTIVAQGKVGVGTRNDMGRQNAVL